MTADPPIPTVSTLTPRQREILTFIRARFAETDGLPLTYRDISRHFDHSYITARRHVEALERKGRLRVEPGQYRSIRPVETQDKPD